MDFQVLLDLLNRWYPIILQLVGAFSVLATVTPNKVDDKILQFFMDVVNFLGANLGKAKNDPNK